MSETPRKNGTSPTRRRLAAAIGAGLGSAAFAGPQAAFAQTYPNKPVRIVVAYGPGGASDVTARLLSEKLSMSLGQPVVVDNRPGANGIIALEHVAKSAPDGYTLLMANVGPNAINPAVYDKLPYDAKADFAPIIFTTIVPQVLVVNPKRGFKNLQDFIAYVKANPGKLSYANGGNGSSNHLAFEQLKLQAGLYIVPIPYRGDPPSMTDTISGEVDATIPTVLAAAPHIKSGRLQALAVTTKDRVGSLADVPTMAEAGVPGYESFSWGGVMAPKGTPGPIVERLNKEILAALQLADVRQKLEGLGARVSPLAPVEFAAFLDREIEKYRRVAQRAKIKAE